MSPVQRITTLIVITILFTAHLSQPSSAAPLAAPLRLGVLGDSGSDEYRGTDNRGGAYASVTYNWVEQLVGVRGVDMGAAASWGEPRRVGLEYNWARSGATAADMITQRQHTGLAAQIAAGKIDVVIVNIGFNDFAPYRADGYAPIYDGRLSGTALQAKIDAIVANITTAVDTLRAARRIPVIVSTIGDWNFNPAVANNPNFSDPVKRQRVSDAIARTNAGILAMVKARGLTLFDSATFLDSIIQRIRSGTINVGGQLISPFSTGDEPHNGILSDRIHPGTVISGLLANHYLMAINSVIDTDIPLMSDWEILQTAGLTGSPTNQAPSALNDSYTMTEDGILRVAASGVLSNDSDPNRDLLLAVLVGTVTSGYVELSSDGSFVYRPLANFNGRVSFTYSASDGRLTSSSATVSVTVSAVNDAPYAGSDQFTTRGGMAITILPSSLLANDHDIEGDTLSVSGVGSPTQGTLTRSGVNYVYTPRAGYVGDDTFSYTVSDGKGGSASGIVRVVIS
jgi:lysophospholipase L1-like esterase